MNRVSRVRTKAGAADRRMLERAPAADITPVDRSPGMAARRCGRAAGRRAKTCKSGRDPRSGCERSQDAWASTAPGLLDSGPAASSWSTAAECASASARRSPCRSERGDRRGSCRQETMADARQRDAESTCLARAAASAASWRLRQVAERIEATMRSKAGAATCAAGAGAAVTSCRSRTGSGMAAGRCGRAAAKPREDRESEAGRWQFAG